MVKDGDQNLMIVLEISNGTNIIENSFLKINISHIILDIYPREIKTYFTKICSGYFVIVQNQTHLKCPPIGEWINKPWFTPGILLYNERMKDYPAIINIHYNIDKFPNN